MSIPNPTKTPRPWGDQAATLAQLDDTASGEQVRQPGSSADAQAHLHALGLERNPFPVVPDARGFFVSERNEAIITEILHGIESRKGFLVITGEVGLGKTTLSRRLLAQLSDRGVQTALVFNTFHQGADLLQEINRDFGICADSRDLRAQMSVLNEFLLKNLALGVNCAVIVDDAQQLSVESLELLRQVSNLETASEKLVQILLIGQPELWEKLNTHELRQLRSRIVQKYVFLPWTAEETCHYVQFKLMRAGGHGRLTIAPRAFRLLHRLTGGNPRQINKVMDRCLYAVIARGTSYLGRRLLAEAAREVNPESDGVMTRGSPWTAIAATALLLAPLLAFAYYQLSPALRGVTHAPAVTADAVEIAPAPAAQPVTEAGEITPAAVTLPDVAPVADPQVTSFLSAYSLERFAPRLTQALAGDSAAVDAAAEAIAAAAGLRPVRVPGLPIALDHYPALRIAGSNELLLFWRPNDVPHGDTEVRSVQSGLHALGYYAGEVDGIIGPLTLRSILDFQAAMGLPRTGHIDTPARFMLQELSRGAAAPAPEAAS